MPSGGHGCLTAFPFSCRCRVRLRRFGAHADRPDPLRTILHPGTALRVGMRPDSAMALGKRAPYGARRPRDPGPAGCRCRVRLRRFGAHADRPDPLRTILHPGTALRVGMRPDSAMALGKRAPYGARRPRDPGPAGCRCRVRLRRLDAHAGRQGPAACTVFIGSASCI